MNNIKFSHNYPKIWNQTSAKLLEVEKIKITKHIDPDLLEYDTKISDGSYYPLKTGNYLQLIFLGNKGIPFCTIRSAWPNSKADYYNSRIGEWFNITITQ